MNASSLSSSLHKIIKTNKKSCSRKRQSEIIQLKEKVCRRPTNKFSAAAAAITPCSIHVKAKEKEENDVAAVRYLINYRGHK